MALNVGQPFKRTSKGQRFEGDVMTKAQMLLGDDTQYEDGYLVVEKDSHDLYIYNSSATPSQETGKFVKSSGSGGGSSLPDGGTTGQILAKNSDDDGDAGWIVDTGKDLNKLVEWGSHTSQSPKMELVPTITDATQDPYHRVILHIPIQGSALQGIEATEASLKQYLKTRFKIRYNTDLNGTVVFTTTTEDTAGAGSNSFGMKTNLASGYADSQLYIYLNETTISNNILHLAVNYYVKFSASQTNHNGKPENVVLIANDGYTFGTNTVNDPYYIHNSTKIALDDLNINNFNIPTSWGVATSGIRQVDIVNQVGQFTVDISDLQITNRNDYNVAIEVIGGGTGARGDSTHYLWAKSINSFSGSVTTVGSDVDRVDIGYTVFAKGYGNITSGGGGGDVPENIVTARATTGAGDVDIYSMTGTSNEYTPVEDKVTMDLRVIQGGTYSDLPEFNISTAGAGNPIYSKHLATTDYVDTEVAKKQNTLVSGTNIKTVNNQSLLGSGDIPIPTIVGSDWGVAKTGSGAVPAASGSRVYNSTSVDISDLGFTSANDYQVVICSALDQQSQNASTDVSVIGKSATSFTVKALATNANMTLSFAVPFLYTIFAKGYGSVPNGGTTGQALVKKSNTDGDVEWKTVGGESTIDKIKVNNVEQTITDKTVNIEAVQFNGTKLHGQYADATLSGGVTVSMDFTPTTDGMQYKTEYDDGIIHTTTKDLVDKTYVDSKSPTIVNEGATFSNAQGNQKMQIRTGSTNSVIIKDTNGDGTTEYWSYELPDKDYVDTTILSQEKTIDNDYYYTSREPSGYKLFKKNQTSNASTASTFTSSNITLHHNSGSGFDIQDLSIATQENGTCSVQMSNNMMSAFNSALGVGVNMEVGAEKLYGTYTQDGVTYQVYSKIVYIPALPSTAGITTYPMGVSNIKQILNIYGYTTDGFILNAPRQNVQDNISIYQVSKGSQTFSIEVGKDRSSKSAYVTIVYAKNNT